MSQTTSRNDTSTSISRNFIPPQDDGGDDGGNDPLAQTFMVNTTDTVDTGCFITKLDLFFQKKDQELPVWVEIRNVVNGYPVPRLCHLVEKC